MQAQRRAAPIVVEPTQVRVFEARERERMASGFYLVEATGEDLVADADVDLEEPEADDAPGAEPRPARRWRAVSLDCERFPKRDLEAGRALFPEQPGVDYERPKTRADCAGGERPCPYVSCQHHLYLDVVRGGGSIKLNFGDVELEELPETCVLDVADRGPLELRKVAELLGGVSRARIQQIEADAFQVLRRRVRHLPMLLEETTAMVQVAS